MQPLAKETCFARRQAYLLFCGHWIVGCSRLSEPPWARGFSVTSAGNSEDRKALHKKLLSNDWFPSTLPGMRMRHSPIGSMLTGLGHKSAPTSNANKIASAERKRTSGLGAKLSLCLPLLPHASSRLCHYAQES
eukprot:5699511-Amphidinium_carterae.2